MKLSKRIAGGITMSLLISSVAMAEDYNPMLDDKWRVYVGAFNASVDSKLTLNAENLPSIPIDVEDILGLEDSKTVAWGGVAWHFAAKHALEFEMFTLNRNDSQSETYTPAVQIGDFFIEDGELSTSYDTNLARLTYAYSIVRNERSDLNANIKFEYFGPSVYIHATF
jgi:hypothetical protein